MTTPSRTGKELLSATRPFTSEQRARSIGAAVTTAALLVAAATLAALARAPLVRVTASVLEGLLIVRGFVLYHDVMHGALLRGSRLARALAAAYGVLVLVPPTVWRATHNYHHAHTAKIVGSHVGSYATLTTALWQRATRGQRLAYRALRHPINVLLGYATIFLYGMCLAPFLRAPRRHWDAGLALAVHAAAVVALLRLGGVGTCVLVLWFPFALACALGAYLFYAQHNFPGIVIQPRESWDHTRAALESSSYLATGPVLAWFTGNIGYHHVHHLNPGIPFYRLPEAMAALPELQHPPVTTLRPRDVIACFRQNLWDPARGRMVSYREANALDR